MADLGMLLKPIRQFVELHVPHEDAAVIARLHAVTQVVERDYEGPLAKFKARVAPHLIAEFSPYIVDELQKA